MQTWIEDCLALEKFHKDQVAKHGNYVNSGRSKRQAGWSITDTANDKNLSKGKVSEDLRLAQFYRKNRELCATIEERREALVYLKQFGITRVPINE